MNEDWKNFSNRKTNKQTKQTEEEEVKGKSGKEQVQGWEGLDPRKGPGSLHLLSGVLEVIVLGAFLK